jgi:hypothetical protein
MAEVDIELEQLWDEFHSTVNMNAPELRDWLTVAPDLPRWHEEPDVDLSDLGWQVVSVLGKRRNDVTSADRAVMRQVTDIVAARLANPPERGAAEEGWRHDLMTLGHDPLRAG